MRRNVESSVFPYGVGRGDKLKIIHKQIPLERPGVLQQGLILCAINKFLQ